jgi:hypothetical protein
MSFSPLQTPGERPQQRLPISETGSEDFIEIHHLVPISEFQGLMVSSRPERDYAALCSNCHSIDSPDEGSS